MNDITFAKILSSVMLDNKYDRFVKNRRTGKLDTRSLYKINISPKLFKRREARKNKFYAVSLVVDCSGSMSGGKIKMAAESARKLSKHLSEMGIPHNILAFHLSVMELKPFDASYDKRIGDKLLGQVGIGILSDEQVYGLWQEGHFVGSKMNPGNQLIKFIGLYKQEKAWDERSRLIGQGMNITAQVAPSFNSDAEALKNARERILKQQGKRIMIHLSDGQPAPNYGSYESPLNPGYSQLDFNLKQEVDRTIRAGVELYSIGICSDEVNKFYPPRRTASINDLEQLYPHIIKLIRRNLKRG